MREKEEKKNSLNTHTHVM